MKITKRKSLNFCAVFFASLVILPTPDVPAQSSPKDKRIALNMVYNNLSVGSGPLWVAQNAGIFQKHGLI